MKAILVFALTSFLAPAAWAEEIPKEGAATPEERSELKSSTPKLDLKNQGRHVRISAGDFKWFPAPPSVPRGAKIAVLEGDPKKPGISTFRLKLPAGYKVPPHWHPADERVTVISGVFALGTGEDWDDSTVQEYPAGSFTVMPPRHGHYAAAKTDTVIQLTIVGPWGINYFNSADDPRNVAEPRK